MTSRMKNYSEQDRMISHENQRFMHAPLVTAHSVVVDIMREAIAEVVAG